MTHKLVIITAEPLKYHSPADSKAAETTISSRDPPIEETSAGRPGEFPGVTLGARYTSVLQIVASLAQSHNQDTDELVVPICDSASMRKGVDVKKASEPWSDGLQCSCVGNSVIDLSEHIWKRSDSCRLTSQATCLGTLLQKNCEKIVEK